MTSSGRRSGQWPAGTAWSPIRGDVGPGAVDVRRKPGRRRSSVLPLTWDRARCRLRVDPARPPGTAHWGRGHPSPPRIRPRRARFLPIRRPRRPGPVRREGEVTPVPDQLVLPGPLQPGPPDGPDGRLGRPRRMDGGGHRGRGPAARAQPHPALPAPFQRPAEGRQELPLARPHGERRVAPARRGPGAQASWGPLLRALSERVRHPEHPGSAAAVVPGADLLRLQVPQPRAAGSAVPAVPHRALLGPLRGSGDQGGLRHAGGRPRHLPRR